MELPEGDAPPTNQEPVAVEIDEGVVMQLASMGFDLEGCKKAVFNTKNQGSHTLTPSHSHSHTHTHTHTLRCRSCYELGAGTHGRPRSVKLSNPLDISVILCILPYPSDFSAPFIALQTTPSTTSSGPDEGAVAMVMALGFTREQAMKALKATVSWCVIYSGTSLIRTPMGQKEVSLLVRCPHFRG